MAKHHITFRHLLQQFYVLLLSEDELEPKVDGPADKSLSENSSIALNPLVPSITSIISLPTDGPCWKVNHKLADDYKKLAFKDDDKLVDESDSEIPENGDEGEKLARERAQEVRLEACAA